MLINSLSFKQRGGHFLLSEKDIHMLADNMQTLHQDDSALLKYFGFGRDELKSKLNKSNSFCTLEASASEHIALLSQKLDMLDNCNNVTSDQLPGYGLEVFGQRFYNLFAYWFKNDPRFPKISNAIDVDSFIASIKEYIVRTVQGTAEQSLVHWLNTCIAEGQSITCAQFIERLKIATLRPIMEAYPVLAKLLIEFVEAIVEYTYKIIQDFSQDLSLLVREFDLVTRKISALHLGLGDPHGQTQTVCSVHIGDVSIIYKPRSGREGVFYNQLLKMLYTKTSEQCLDIYSPVTVCFDNHSWVERIDHVACEHDTDVAAFYQKMGAQIAVIHALNGIDFHRENIIARGSCPVMIDLECLFTGAVSDLLFDLPAESALMKAFRLTRQSVFSSGFVPFAHGAGTDVSGLSRQKIYSSSVNTLLLENGFYHLKKVTSEHQPISKHLPIIGREYRELDAYREAFMSGFDIAYEALVINRQGIINFFRKKAPGLKSRVLIKNTQRYAKFIALGHHPRFTQNMLDRELLLATQWRDIKSGFVEAEMPAHEIEDLKALCVPYFSMDLTTHYLENSRGEKIDVGGIDTPEECCVRKLMNLSAIDKRWQTTVLETCLFSESSALELSLSKGTVSTLASSCRSRQLHRAIEIADSLDEHAIQGRDGDIYWLAFHTHGSTHRRYLAPMSEGLYSGLAGLGVFYLALFKASGDQRYLTITDRILLSLSNSLDYPKNDISISSYHGIGSYLYLLANRKIILGESLYDEAVEHCLLLLITATEGAYSYDFLSGCCGAITLLSNLHKLHPRDDVRLAIVAMVRYLKKETAFQGGQCYQNTDQTLMLTGLSHGISGAIYALSKAYEVTGDSSLMPLVEELLNAENQLTRDGFWLDMREADNPGHASMWCHGDGGILLARRQVLVSFKGQLNAALEQKVMNDIQTCEHNLWQPDSGRDYSLCHGKMGNLLCLQMLYQGSDNQAGLDRVEQAQCNGSDRFFASPILNTERVPNMGLMTGITGVGYALLYSLDQTLPNVLTLEFASLCDVKHESAEPSTSPEERMYLLQNSAFKARKAMLDRN